MPRILFGSHPSSLTTSYARVVRQFAAAAAEVGHEVAFAADGVPVADDLRTPAVAGHRFAVRDPESWPSLVRGTADGGVLTPVIARTLADGRFDLLVTVGDPWMFEGLEAAGVRPRCRWLACFPLDGGPVPRAWAAWMGAADERVVFSRFAADLVAAAVGRPPRLLYHGVDRSVFRPLDKADAKRRVVGTTPGGGGEPFVVGCVAANQPRKNLPALLRAFAAFAPAAPDVLLYLHAPVVGYWDLEALADHLGITSRVRATLGYDPLRGVPDQTLAVVYNAFDVLALPTMGEGFGLPLLEAQACGVPAIATDCSACPELLPDPVQRVRVSATLMMARNIEQAVVDEADLAQKLSALYRDKALRGRLATAGLALADRLDWREIRARFADTVDSLLA